MPRAASERLHRGVRTRVLVARYDDRLALLLRHRAPARSARRRARPRLRRRPAGASAGRTRPAARDVTVRAVPLDDVLRRLAHRVRVVHRGKLRVREPPAERRVLELAAPRSHAASALPRTYGARVIDSTPPATNTSPSSTAIAWAAALMAWRPEPHSRLTVWPATSTGRPARSAAMRATFRLSSPAWFAAPRITSSMSAGSIPDDRRPLARRGPRGRPASPRRAPRRTARPGSEPPRRSRPPGRADEDPGSSRVVGHEGAVMAAWRRSRSGSRPSRCRRRRRRRHRPTCRCRPSRQSRSDPSGPAS